MGRRRCPPGSADAGGAGAAARRGDGRVKTASVTPLVPSRGAASRGLRIAMVAPPYFALPPIGYGGVEVVVAGLVDELVERGHHITLLGAGRNGTRAQTFVSTYAEPPADQLGAALPELIGRRLRVRAHEGLCAGAVPPCAEEGDV